MIEEYPRESGILAKPEDFKGITYVRLSALPAEQGVKIRESHYRHSIIKILNDHSMMNDCMIYNDYMDWHKQVHSSVVTNTQKVTPIHSEFQTTN